MPLPVGKLGTDSITIDGVEIPFRSLSVKEALGIDGFKDRRAEAPSYIIRCGTGASEDEAAAFLDSHSLQEGVKLVNAILKLSGLSDTFRAGIPDAG